MGLSPRLSVRRQCYSSLSFPSSAPWAPYDAPAHGAAALPGVLWVRRPPSPASTLLHPCPACRPCRAVPPTRPRAPRPFRTARSGHRIHRCCTQRPRSRRSRRAGISRRASIARRARRGRRSFRSRHGIGSRTGAIGPPALPRPAPPRPALPYQAPCPAPQGAARGRGLTARPPCRPSQQQHLDAPRVPSAEGHRGASLCKPSASVASVSDAVRPATLFSPPLSLPRQLLPPQRGPSRHVPRLGSRRATRTRVSAQMRARWTPWPSLWRSGEPLRDALAFGSLPF
jgi:hypothetical protein